MKLEHIPQGTIAKYLASFPVGHTFTGRDVADYFARPNISGISGPLCNLSVRGYLDRERIDGRMVYSIVKTLEGYTVQRAVPNGVRRKTHIATAEELLSDIVSAAEALGALARAEPEPVKLDVRKMNTAELITLQDIVSREVRRRLGV